MSNKSSFVTGPLADTIGLYGDNSIVDNILDGTITHKSLGINPLDVDNKLYAFLNSVQYTTTSAGDQIEQMNNVILLNEEKRPHQKHIWVTTSPYVNEIVLYRYTFQ